MKKTLIIFSASLLLLAQGFVPAIAHAETSPQVQAVSEVIATVNIANATSTQSGHTFAISFDISNRVGVQPDVKYGVSLLKVSAAGISIADEYVYSETLTLGANQSVHKNIMYTAPASLSGTYVLRLASKNTRGVPFAMSELGTVTLPEQKGGSVSVDPSTCFLATTGGMSSAQHALADLITVSSSETLNATCTVRNSTKNAVTLAPLVVQHVRDAYGSLVMGSKSATSTTVVVPANGTKVVTVAVARMIIPQAYYVAISLQDQATRNETNKIITRYLLEGVGASIRTLSLDRDGYGKGDTANVSFMWSFFDSASIAPTGSNKQPIAVTARLSLVDGNKIACAAQASQDLTRDDQLVKVPVIITADCHNPQLTLSIVNKNGEVMDTQTFSIITHVSPNATLTTTEYLVVAGLLLLLVLAAFLYWKKLRSGTSSLPIAMLLLSFALAGGARSAHADSVYITYVCGSSAPCPQASAIYATGNLDQSSYTPGQTVVFQVSMISDDNPQLPSGVSPIAYGAINNASRSADVFPNMYTPQELRVGISGSIALGVAPDISGTVNTYYGAGGYSMKYSSIPLVVTQPQSCTINQQIDLGNGNYSDTATTIYVNKAPTSVRARSYPPKYSFMCTGSNGGFCAIGPYDALGNTTITCSETYVAPPSPPLPPPSPVVNINFSLVFPGATASSLKDLFT